MKSNNKNLIQDFYLRFKNFIKFFIPSENKALLTLYYKRLWSTHEYLKQFNHAGEKDNKKSNNSSSLDDIKKDLEEKEETWDNGNKIEQQMVFMMDADMLDFEIDRKLLGAKRYFEDNYINLYKDQKIKIQNTDETQKKRLLLRLMQDIQWQIRKRKSMEPDIEIIRMTMMVTMAISILCTLLTYNFIFTSSQGYPPYFILVISAGFMGTIFSMLMGVAKQPNELILDDLQNLLSIWHIGVKITLGVGAALLFYYFFQSKLVPLDLFPDIDKLDRFLRWKGCDLKDDCINSLGLDPQDLTIIHEWDANLYELMIWSFLAGFSEQLVPDILNKTKSQIHIGN